MIKKNGFIFVETMIVVVVLIVALMLLYSSYTGFLTVERRFARYDDPAYIYKTQALATFLANIKDPLNKSKLAAKIEYNSDTYINITQFDESGLLDDEKDKTFFANLISDLRIQNILIMNKTQIQNLITNYYNKTGNTDIIDEDFIIYLKQLNIPNGNYVLIASYAEKSNGSECDPNEIANINIANASADNSLLERSCIRYYASVPINVN